MSFYLNRHAIARIRRERGPIKSPVPGMIFCGIIAAVIVTLLKLLVL